MRASLSFLIPVLIALGCAGTVSVLGTPTVVSDAEYELAPEITNPDEVREAMRKAYPPLLRDAAIRGKVTLLVYVDEVGQVQGARLEQGSGHGAMDDLAVELAEIIRFNPAQNAGEAVAVLVRIPMDLIPPPSQAGRRRIGWLEVENPTRRL